MAKKEVTKRIFKEGREMVVLSSGREKRASEKRGTAAAKAGAKRAQSRPSHVREKKNGLMYDPFTGRREGPASPTDVSHQSMLSDVSGKGLRESGSNGRKSHHATSTEGTFVDIDKTDIPPSYNRTKITLLVKDPNWAYAYWGLSGDTIASAKAELGGDFDRSRVILRTYDVTMIDFNGSNANHWFDIEVGWHTSSRYINVWTDNISYCAEIGLLAPSGRFYPLARSNVIHLPRLRQSERWDVIWMDVKNDAESLPFITPRAGAEREKGLAGKAVLRTPSDKNAGRRMYLTHEDMATYYSRFFKLLERILLARLAKRYDLRQLRPYLSKHGFFGPDGRFDILPDGTIHRTVFLGASEMLVERSAMERESAGGSHELAGSQSLMALQQKKKKGFYFTLDTELIVYGRTESNAEVHWGNKRVALRDDGTFTLRFALPDGFVPLDFTARSNDKSMRRRITTAVERYPTRREGEGEDA